MLFNDLDNPLDDYDLIDLVRLEMEEEDLVSITLVRPVKGLHPMVPASWPQHVIDFDCVKLTKEDFDRMSNREVLQYVDSTSSYIN